MQQYEFLFDPKELRALMAMASFDPTRPHIASLGVSWAGGWAGATDGHRMALVEGWRIKRNPGEAGSGEIDPFVRVEQYPVAGFSEPAEAIVPRETLDRAVKASTKGSLIHVARDHVRVFQPLHKQSQFAAPLDLDGTPIAGIKIPYRSITDDDYTYPPLGRELPSSDRDPGKLVAVNAQYLAEAALFFDARAKAWGTQKRSSPPYTHLTIGGELDVIRLHGCGALVAIMPTRM